MKVLISYLLTATALLGIAATYPGPKAPKIHAAPFTEAYLNDQILAQAKQSQYDAAEETASRIFKQNCGDDEYAELVAHASVDKKLPVRIVSALIVVESTCRANVTSSEGAVGLMQVSVRTWHVPADWLKDPEYNIRKGTDILASYTAAHGIREGLHRYNGLGVGCDACDGQYPDKVLLIAGYRQ